MKNALLVGMLLLGSLLAVPAHAQTLEGGALASDPLLADPAVTDPGSPLDSHVPGAVEGTGTHFEITDSAYLNVTLDSTETITLRLSSTPEMVTLRLEPSAERSSALITLGGFQPGATYYKYEDDYHNKDVFTTDAAGSYSFTEDITVPHMIFIQPRKSTKFISDNATGGDCTLIGSWDNATKTCTLLMDLAETVQIDSNNVTLDGNGHTSTGTGTGNGVYLPGRSGVTVRNLVVRNFVGGIVLVGSSNNTIANNTVTNLVTSNFNAGIELHQSNGNTVSGNTASNNLGEAGILLEWSANNTVSGNTTANNKGMGILLTYGSMYGRYWGSMYNLVANNTVTGNQIGIRLITNGYYPLDYNTLTANTVSSNNTYGIELLLSGGNTLTNNIATGNSSAGVSLDSTTGNTLQDNTLQDNGGGLGGVYAGLFYFGEDLSLYRPGEELDCDNTIQNNTGSGGRPILYANTAVDLDGGTYSQVILCNADGSTLRNVTVKGSDTIKNNGLDLVLTDNARLTNVTSSGNGTGIHFHISTHNVVENSTASNNRFDGVFQFGDSTGNTVTNSTFQGNGRTGVVLYLGTTSGISITGNTVTGGLYGIYDDSTGTGNSIIGNTVTGAQAFGLGAAFGKAFLVKNNTVRNSATGIYLYNASGGSIYNNSFIDNTLPASISGVTGNVFNLARPAGGNYWSSFDAPSEGCFDADHDGFCDAPYTLATGNVDYLPWTTQGGWNVPQDTVPPTTTSAIAGAAGNNGWYRSDVQVTLTAVDNAGGSGVKEIHYTLDGTETVVAGGTASFTISAEGTHTVTYYAKDNAGNAETPHPLAVNIDKTSPSITASAAPSPNANGWNNTDVTVTFSCLDATSGTASCTGPVAVTAEGANQIVTGTAADNAGNSASASVALNIDKTPPAVTATVSPAPNANGWNNTNVTVTFTCSDALSGISACPAPVTVTTEGAGQTVMGTAIDKAGNSSTASVTVNIDKTPPAVSLSMSPSLLWPPNHRMVTVSPVLSVSDNLDPAPQVRLLSVTSNEPDNGLGDGDTANDIVVNADGTLSLRAERSGMGSGRVYTVIYQVTDRAGNASTATATVTVPHNK